MAKGNKMNPFTIIFNQIKELKAKKYRQEQAEIESLEKAKLEIEAMLNKKG